MSVAAVEHGASFERVLRALEGAGQLVRRSGTRQAQAQCPVHADGAPSLSVSWKDGKTLLHCFNGCTDGTGGRRADPGAVLAAIGLTADDLFDEPRSPRDPGRVPRPRRHGAAGTPTAAARPAAKAAAGKRDQLGKPTGRWRVVAEYDGYTAEDGAPLGKVIRQQRDHEHGYAKRFWQQHWIGQCTRQPCTEKRGGQLVVHESGWGPGAPARKVLCWLPKLIAAIAAGHEVWLPEGEKDAIALNDHFRNTGYAAFATTNASGARSWRQEYAQALAGAHVVIVEDIDPPKVNLRTGEVTEPDGRVRTRMLLASLHGAAASVRVVRAKAGKDSFDHLAAGHAAADFEAVTIPAADPAEAAPGGAGRGGLRLVRSAGDGPGGGGGAGGGEDGEWLPNRRARYLIRHGEIVRETTDRSGTMHYDVILGCTAQIIRVEQKILAADETPATTGYLLQVEHPGHEGDVREITVPRKSWDSGDWLHDLPWPNVTFDSSRNGIAKVRDAIRITSPATAVAQVHGAPGWVTAAGKWLYVHAGGALGADGPAEVTADLPSKLAHYCLPEPPASPQALRDAADHSVGLVAALPARMGAVLAGLAYRAAISRMPPAVTLIGPPMSYKTSMAKVALHHFAPDLPWDESVLSLSELHGATGNAAAKIMNLSRDTLLLADDAAPDRSLRSAAARVAGIVRLQYNGEVRDRLDREQELRRPAPPRGSLLVSAEIGPSAASASQRTLLVPFAPGQISRETRIALWERESRHGRAAVTASFITWQASRRDEILARLQELTRDYADTWHAAGFDERTAEALSHLAAGWRLMLMHLVEAGAYSAEEAEVIWHRAWEGLAEAGRTQDDPDEPSDPAAKILGLLRTGLLGRYGYLTAPEGGPPPVTEAPRYGWSVETLQARGALPGQPGTTVARAQGEPVGCYADENGERRLWLIPELALIMLRRVADRLGEPFEETVKSVSSMLHQAGIGLAVTPVPSTGMTRRAVQRQVPGSIGGKRRPWVWDIPEAALWDGPDGHAGAGHAGDGGGGNVGTSRFDGGDAHAGDPAGQTPQEAPWQCGSSGSGSGGQSPAGEQAAVPGNPAAATGPGELILYPQLLNLADRDGQRDLSPAVLRRRYCSVEQAEGSAAQPCAACGGRCVTLVGGVPLHLTCPDPEPGWQPADAAPVDTEEDDADRADPAARSPGGGAASGGEADRAALRRPRGGAEAAGERWRGPAAVLAADGIYLPGGERLPLPEEVAHAGSLGDLPARLNLGWGGGRLPPHAGQLWLTASFLERIAGLPVPGEGISAEDRDALLTEAARRPFITGADAAGWQISDASKTRLGHRMRIWRDGNRAGAQLVFIPYITGDVALLDGNPDPAALAERLAIYARLAGVPYGRSAAYSGHDLIMRLDARRKIVLTGPADPVPVGPTSSGLIGFQRAPSGVETRMRFLHSYDATAAWLAAAQGTVLGVGGWVHRDQLAFDPKLTALWRVQRPKWDLWAIPDPFAPSRKPADGTVRLYTPLLAMAAELLDAEITPVEAWVWPEHTRYLDTWAHQLDRARQALAGPEPPYKPRSADDAAVLAAIKDTYSGAVTLFGSPQLDRDTDPETGVIRLERHRLFRGDWAHTLIDTSAARLYRKILAVEAAEPGRWPIAIDRDNLLYASDDPDPEHACPAALTIGNRLGQVKPKGSALLADAGPKLAAGKFSFEELTGREKWDPVRGGPRDRDE